MSDENKFEDLGKDSLYAIMAETEKLAKVGGWEWDISGDVWTFSDNWLRIHGCSSRHMKSADLLPIAHPDDRNDIQAAFDKAITEGANYEIEHRIIRQDNGEERHIRALGKPKFNKAGKVVKLLGSAQDITEHKKAEEELLQTKILLESSIESPKDMIILSLDREYRYLYFNKAHSESMTHVYGTKPQIGGCIFNYMEGSDDIERVKYHYDRALAGEGHVAINEYGKGQLRYIYEIQYNPIYDKNNDIFGVSAFAQNISERVNVESALRESSDKFKFFFEESNVGKSQTLPTGEMVVNKAFADFLGYSSEELAQKKWQEITPHEDLEPSQEMIAPLLKGEKDSARFSKRYIHKNGSLVWADVSVRMRRDAEGNPLYFVTTIVDINEQKKAQEALEFEKSRAQQYLDVADILLIALDSEGKVALINPKGCQILGYPKDEILGKNWFENFLLRENIEEVKKVFHKIISGDIEPVKYYENPIVRMDGAIRQMAWHNSVLKDEFGTIIGLFSSGEDITDQKEWENTLRESEERYRLLAEKTKDIIWTMNLKLEFTYVNPAIETIFGYTPTEWIGSKLQDHCDKENFDLMAQIVAEELLKGPDHSGVIFEAVMINKNGDTIPVEIHGQVLFDESGEPFSLQGITRDITERREAEAALRTSEKRMRATLDASPFPIVLVDSNDDVVHYWSRSAQELFGHTAPTAAEWYQLAYPDPKYRLQVIEKWKPCLEIARESGRPVNTGEYRITCKDGSVRICEIYATFISEGLIVSFNDNTEKRMIEEKEATLQSQLHQAQKIESIGRLAGGVAHDFNNMLSIILGHTEMGLEQLDDGHPLQEDLNEIQKAAKRSADLTRQLLAFARKDIISPKVLTVNDVVKNMLKMLQRLIGEDIDLAWRPGDQPWHVQIDPSQLDQVLVNLCVNAREAISGIGKIIIETENVALDEEYCADRVEFIPGDYFMLAVSDDGCGMEKEIIANIFEPFFTTKKSAEGTGLGLSTVYGIIKQNNGFINVYSEPGSGTTFKIYLPRHLSTEQKISQKTSATSNERGNETILLVEDEKAILNMAKRMLERIGYKVFPASTPGEAMEFAREYKGEIHLLMTDVVMPEMNGRDLARNLISLYPNLKRVFMSGYTANVIAHHGVLDEGVNFIQKPFSSKDLAAKVRKALDK